MEPGTTLGPYRIDRELGSGGMGTVYRAEGPDGVVALKIVHPRLLEGADAVERFQREVEIGCAVDHPNVVRTYAGGESDGRHYLAMEYVEGQTLDGLLEELERVPEDLCRHVGSEICKGLSAIHAAGAIHRDMKPENVMITPDHMVKIMDLGVARSTDDALRLSQTGAFVGSLHYAAPEQFTGGGKGLDGRCDLHALGLVLYELASGVCPYYADAIPQIVRKVLHEEPRRLGELNPQLSAFFEEVVHCLLAKNRDERFATADELRTVLELGEDADWWRERARALQLASRRPIRRARIPRETAVYGREDEIATLRALYERAKSGAGNVVLIGGEAGIGKSRLVDELIGRLQQDGEDINFLCGGYPPGGAATIDGGFSSAFREQFGEDGSAAYLPENEILVPAFDALLRGEGAPPDAQPLTRGSLQTCFARATQALAAQRVTVVLIDDLHFAPEEGRALFTSLAMAMPGHRVLLIGTARPGVSQDWTAGLTRLDHATHLPLHRLGPKDLVQLLRDTLQSEHLARDLGDQIAVKSDGNPFFVFEILRGLREGQFITQNADGTWVSTGVIDDIQIPSSVLDLVNARVADLSEEQRDLLDVASCWGYEFDPALVGEVVGLARIPTLKRFGQIERQHRLTRSIGRNYVFDHHQVQEALYDSLNEQLREEYHAALAEGLETRSKAADKDPETLDGALCVDLCEHYLKGARGESAVRYLPAAQAHLTSGYLHAAMAALTERALAVPDLLVGAERAQTLLRLVDALSLVGRPTRQEECAREATALAEATDDDRLLGDAVTALGAVLFRTQRQTEAEAAIGRALALAQAIGERQAEAGAMVNLGLVRFAQGRLAEARDHYERGAAICREYGHRQYEANALVNLATIFMVQGRPTEAQDHFERSLALNREIGDRRGEAIAVASLGTTLLALGRPLEAQEHLERGLALFREIGDRDGEANATGNLGPVFTSLGRFREARERLERQVALSREIGNRQGEAVALVNLGPAWHGLGDRARARSALEQSVTICREIGARYPEGFGLLDLGRLADEEGDGALALQLTQESLALRREIGYGDGVAESLTELGDLHLRAGRMEPARTALEEAAGLCRAQGRKAQLALALSLVACLPQGDAEAALTALAELDEHGDSARLRWMLHRATGDRAHLAAAKRLLDESLAKVPEEYHEAMLTNLRLSREIMAACKEQGL